MSDNEIFEEVFKPPPAIENTTIPMLLGDKVISDNEVWYMLRLTPDSIEYALTDVTDDLLKSLADQYWFLSEELSKKGIKHYHCVFLHLSPDYLDPREAIKEWLLTKFPGKWKKADGNKRYNLQVAEKPHEAFKYTSKDGDYYIGSGINPEYISLVNSQSFQKKDARIGQLAIAREDFINDKMTDRELFSKVCDIIISTSPTGSLNPTVARNFVMGAKASKDPSYKDYLFKSLGI